MGQTDKQTCTQAPTVDFGIFIYIILDNTVKLANVHTCIIVQHTSIQHQQLLSLHINTLSEILKAVPVAEFDTLSEISKAVPVAEFESHHNHNRSYIHVACTLVKDLPDLDFIKSQSDLEEETSRSVAV